MTPESLRAKRAALQRAGDALRRRPFEATLAALGAVLDGWRDPGSAWREALEAELPVASGFSPETVREGLRLALEGWSGKALEALALRELQGPVDGFPTTAVLLAGAIPMPSLLSMLAPLVLRSPVLVKCASRDRVTPRLVARSLIETDAELGECVHVVDFRSDDDACVDALLEAECVVATGSDATIAAVAARMQPGRRLVAHGHRLSLAALGQEACTPEWAARLALDVALWDQQGCLSPLAVYVPTAQVDAVGELLAAALADLEQRLPRGSIDPRSAGAVQAERAEAELRAASGHAVRVLAGPGTTWTVVCEDAPAVRAAPLHRFVRIFPVRSAHELVDALRAYAEHLAGVALAGFGGEQAALETRLRELGVTRICEPGALQAPPLDWRRDEQAVLASLVTR